MIQPLPKIVYVIDDEEIDCLIAESILTLHFQGLTIHTFHSVQAAIDHLERVGPDNKLFPSLILLDINMPVKNGWEFLDHYKNMSNYPFNGCKIIMLTSSLHPVDKEKSITYIEVTNLFIKPFSTEYLSKTISPLIS